MKKLLVLPVLLLLNFQLMGQTPVLQTFPLSSVKLKEGPFKNAQDVDLKYILEMDVDRLLSPYLEEAGLEPKAPKYGNWENTGLDGHIGGHYLTALSLMIASTGNPEAKQRLDYMVDWLEKCQQKNGNGYVGGVPGGKKIWEEIAKGHIDAGGFSLNKKWAPLYNIHKIFAGLLDAYTIAGNAKAKDILIKLTDWCIEMTANLSDAQMQDMLRSEHGGLNEVFAELAAITGEAKYLELAKRFSHQVLLEPLIEKQDKLNGMHANTQIPKVVGFMRIAQVSDDPQWAEASDFFWKTVVKNRSVSIGGNSVREHFHPSNNFNPMIEDKEGPETCNTYNMLKLSKSLFTSKPDIDYINYYERAMYNHILSSQHPERGGFVYFTSMRPRHYRVYSQPHEGFWCCVGSGIENHGKYGELIYAHNGKDVYVNLFVASSLSWKEKGLVLDQLTEFPYKESSDIKVQLDRPQKFKMLIRNPSWIKKGGFKLMVNNKAVKADYNADYVVIDRKWKSGDIISVSLPMETKAEYLPDGSQWVSFVHGPIVLAAATDTDNLVGLQADGSRMGHIAHGPLYPIEEAPLILATGDNIAAGLKKVNGKPLTFSASSIIESEKYRNVELRPFFEIHDARYIVYWPVTTKENLARIKEEIARKEELKLNLELLTVDQVAPGEQQPESDHNFQGERTEAGVHRDRHWRHTSAWFSYDLKNKGRSAKKLRITYYGLDRGRSFDIYLNDILLATVTLDGSKGDNFFDVDYELPEAAFNAAGENLKLKFVAHPNSLAGGIYYVRLMK